MSRKVLIVTGDGGDSYEALYACQRFQEARWEPVVAAPARRKLHMLLYDSEAGWDTYVERPGHSVEANVALTAVVGQGLRDSPDSGRAGAGVPAQRPQRPGAGARIRGPEQVHWRHRPRNSGAHRGRADQGPHGHLPCARADRGGKRRRPVPRQTGGAGWQAGDRADLEGATRSSTGRSLPAWKSSKPRGNDGGGAI